MSSIKPIAVLISDVHYSVPTLELADNAIRQAIAKANALDVPLIVAGDLHDTKANMRAECVNAMIDTFTEVSGAFILRGNHDAINEKSKQHALNFLAAQDLSIVSSPTRIYAYDLILIPYEYDIEVLRTYLKTIPKGSTVIMHQGLTSAAPGEYTHDKTAISKEDVAGLRVISGHYHSRQDITLPEGGLWSYIGNSYTLNYGEANDPPKGFQVLYDDGSLQFINTYLRRHTVRNLTFSELNGKLYHITLQTVNDLILVKLTGTKEELCTVNKVHIAQKLGIMDSFRLDLIPLETTSQQRHIKSDMAQDVLLDHTIVSLENTSDEQKARLKQLWRTL